MSGRKWHADKMPIKNLEDDITQLHHHRFLFCFPVTPHPTCSICQCVIALLQCRSTTTVPLLLPSHSPSHLQHLPVRDCTFAMEIDHHRFLFCFPRTPHPTCSTCQCVIALLPCRLTTNVPLLIPSHSPSHLQHLPVRDCTFAMQAAVNHALSTSTSRGSGGCVVYLCLSLPCSGICGSSCCCTDALRPSRSHRVADL